MKMSVNFTRGRLSTSRARYIIYLSMYNTGLFTILKNTVTFHEGFTLCVIFIWL